MDLMNFTFLSRILKNYQRMDEKHALKLIKTCNSLRVDRGMGNAEFENKPSLLKETRSAHVNMLSHLANWRQKLGLQ